MTYEQIAEIVRFLADRGIQTIETRTKQSGAVLDYMAIFSRNQKEFDDMLACISPLGEEVDTAMQKTGMTFKLHVPIETDEGSITFLKIRKPDPTRPQRGAPDFVIKDYPAFKDKYLCTSGDFTLMFHVNSEMVELKGVDVLVYIKNRPFAEILGK